VGLSTSAKIYLGAVISIGFGLLTVANLYWNSSDPLRFLTFFLLTALASCMKVKLPGVTGTMSVSFVLVLSSVMQFSLAEAVDIAVISALVQCFWKAKQRPRPIHVSFNISLMVLSTAAAFWLYHVSRSHSSLVFSIAAATSAYFLVNTLSVTGAIAATEHKPAFTIWRTTYLWSFPYYLLGASIAASLSRFPNLNWEVALAVLPMLFIIYRSYNLHLRQLEEERWHSEAMAALHLRTIETLALAIEAKDQTTGDHLKRVQTYSKELSKDLGLPEQEKLALEAASILHDVGKIAVPDYIISKPGRLTLEEFEKMKIHPIVGAEIVERIQFPYPVAPIVRAHHEKWNGSGYPLGLRGEQIPMAARILAVVDCFDALASDRQYRKALPLEQAMSVVASESGKSFDPQIVELLGRRYLELEELAQAKPSIEQAKLSMGVKVERGGSPDAGFEAASTNQMAGQTVAKLTQAFDEGSSRLGMSLSLAETLGVLCSRVSALVPNDAIALYLVEGRTLVPGHVHGENFKLLTSLRIGMGEGVAGWVAENHKPILNGNPTVEPGFSSGANSSTLQSVLAVPLHTSSGTIGVLALYRTGKDAFSNEMLEQLLKVSDKIAGATESALEQEHTRIFGNMDAVTGLPNARALYSCLEAEIAKRQGATANLTVLFCGLDGVGELNDSFGSTAAEKALEAVAQGFRACCREVDYLARPGGEDFVFVLPGLSGYAVDARVNTLKQLVRDVGLRLWAADLLSLSAAAVTFPWDGDTVEGLVAEAEKRMHEARALKLRNVAKALSPPQPKNPPPQPTNPMTQPEPVG
jgi:diguanylate cyclase (GGDEF)-like protein/putative nucleotidyltransferase with HDIG domain